jgi:integrase
MANNKKRRASKPAKPPAAAYTTLSYGRSIARACDKAFPPPAPLAQMKDETRDAWKERLTNEQKKELAAWQSANRWHPNQLRHSFATRVRKIHGLEAVQVLLGHSRADVTQVYAERNEELAATIAAQIG